MHEAGTSVTGLSPSPREETVAAWSRIVALKMTRMGKTEIPLRSKMKRSDVWIWVERKRQRWSG